jgi:uncharacterized protein YggE
MPTVLVLLLAVAATTLARADTYSGPPVLVTTGEAILRVPPDLARVRLTTEARAQTAREAQEQEAKRMASVQQQLKQSGIKDEAVRTLSYDLQLEFDYDKGKQIPRGYVARHTIEVRVDDVAKVGDVIGKAVDSGAAGVAGIQFDVKARDDLERAALRQAVEDARARADAAAAGAGTSVAGVIRIDEQRSFEGPRPTMMARGMAAESAAVATPIAAGEIEIRSAVTLTSSLK